MYSCTVCPSQHGESRSVSLSDHKNHMYQHRPAAPSNPLTFLTPFTTLSSARRDNQNTISLHPSVTHARRDNQNTISLHSSVTHACRDNQNTTCLHPSVTPARRDNQNTTCLLPSVTPARRDNLNTTSTTCQHGTLGA